MIASMRGILAEKSPATILLEVAGIGYELSITLATFERLPPTGGECRLYVHHMVKEDDEQLFGFATAEEKRMFLRLLAVGGIGPKVAIAVLGGISASELCAAIANKDVKRICAVKGVGKKIAERIVVELHDKISPADAIAGATPGGISVAPGSAVNDALLALGALGFPPDAARKMVQAAIDAGADPDSTDQIVRKAISRK